MQYCVLKQRNSKYQSESVYRITTVCETMIQTHKNFEHVSTECSQMNEKKGHTSSACKLKRNNKTAAIFFKKMACITKKWKKMLWHGYSYYTSLL